MKSIAIFVLSLVTAAILGLSIGSLILWNMAGQPSRSGGGSWDLGPVFYPIMASPALFIGHAVAFSVFSSERFKRGRFFWVSGMASTVYSLAVYFIALVNGYHG